MSDPSDDTKCLRCHGRGWVWVLADDDEVDPDVCDCAAGDRVVAQGQALMRDLGTSERR